MVWAWFLLLLSVALALHAYREYWRLRSLPQIHIGEFCGDLLRVGNTYIGWRPAMNGSERTIVCFPGFLEDMRYFQALYENDDAELILVNNANYHCPYPIDFVEELHWPTNPFRVGTIEHDGFYLGLVLERIASGRDIVVHGHSRGGAVVLEAGRQYPELVRSTHRSLSALLEAPVLPQARVAGKGSYPLHHQIYSYFMPIAFGRMRNIKTGQLLEMPMMKPTTPLKTRLCRSVFSTARNYATCVTNYRSIVTWQRSTDIQVFSNYRKLTVVVGERDDSLDRESMLASAQRGQAEIKGLSIVETTGTNHFIALEQPETIRAIC